jgi:predicted O-linked N-acetylglucosamine transferase (SPINDLY family)
MTGTVQTGLGYHRQGQFAQAEGCYWAALAENPADFEALRLLAVLKLQLGDSPAAVGFLERAIQLRPSDADALCNLSAALLGSGRSAEALAASDRVLAIDPVIPEALFNRAAALAALGREEEAFVAYSKVIAINPSHVGALFRRSALSAARARYAEALADCEQILALAPQHVDALNNRGNILSKLGRIPEALGSYERGLALVPDHPVLLNNRGTALRRLRRFPEAVAVFDQVLARNPADVGALNNKGAALIDFGRPAEALACVDRASSLSPNDVDILNNRGLALYALSRFPEALASFDRALLFDPTSTEVIHNRAAVLTELDLHAEALASYASIENRPGNEQVLHNRGVSLMQLNDGKEAIATFEAALAANPGFAPARFGICLAQLPVVPADEAEIAAARASYEVRLHELCAYADSHGVGSLMEAVGWHQPFHLAQQGQNDRDLQRRYGTLICKLMAERFPAAHLAKAPGPGERIRVGIVSGFFWWHSNWKIPIQGWIKKLDRGRFSVTGYHTGKVHDSVTEEAASLCDRFVEGPKPLEAWREAILADAPHILIYPEVGMDAAAVRLAAQRLAPVQCGSWGHPDTTGLPSLDYFLSSDLMEPPDAQDHYTEQLVRLPNLSVYYEPVDFVAPPVTRTELGLRDDAVVYWSAQSLFKYLPQYDEVFPRIAREVGDCQFVFIGSQKGERVTDALRRRLDRAFTRFGFASAVDHCVFLPRQKPERFIAASGQCDVLLDNIAWSGCNSILETLAYDLPIVTMAGEFMRGRHGSAILEMMGLGDMIAASLDDYLTMAVRLGRDSKWRDEFKRRIAVGKHRIYHDSTCISALEEFLQRAASGIA